MPPLQQTHGDRGDDVRQSIVFWVEVKGQPLAFVSRRPTVSALQIARDIHRSPDWAIHRHRLRIWEPLTLLMEPGMEVIVQYGRTGKRVHIPSGRTLSPLTEKGKRKQ